MRITASIAGLLLVATTAVAGDGTVRRSAHHIPGRYVAVLDGGASVPTVASYVRNFNGARVHQTLERGIKAVSFEMNDADAQQLARDPRVLFVEEDAVVNTTSVPWGLDRIDQHSLPMDGSYISNGTGANTTVYIVDTGILASHNDFGGRVAAGFSAFDDGNGTTDCNGHGTYVAGIVGGASFGVAPSVTLVPVRVLDCTGAGTISTLLAGLDWVLNDHQLTGRPAVVNMSLSGAPSSALDSEVNSLLLAGLTTVVAAGNSNDDACNYSPSRVPGALTVGASTQSDQRASFSNYGGCVDLFAPGQSIMSDWFSSPTATAVASGTSSAAPFVTGVAALVLDKFPTAGPADVEQTILDDATSGVLSNVGTGSPNLLLYSTIDTLSTGSQQLLNDPGFDDGTTFWTSTVCDPTNPNGCYPGDLFMMMAAGLPGHSANTHATFGGKAPNVTFTSETIAVPSNIKRGELSFYLWVYAKSQRPQIDSTFKAEIRDQNGTLLETLGTFTNLDQSTTYVQRKFDMTRYRGMTIRISFETNESNGSNTFFLLDDAALKIWR